MSLRQTMLALIAGSCCTAVIADEKENAVEAAMRMVQTGNATAAVEALEPYYTIEDWAVCFWLGTAHLALGNLDLARAYLDDALLTGAQRPDIWIQRAVVDQESGRPEVAIELLHVAASLDSDHPLVQLNLGYALEKTGRYAEAIAAYRAYLAYTAGQRNAALRNTQIMDRIVALANALSPSPTEADRPQAEASLAERNP